MSFNFSNLGQQALQNLLPMFQSMANGVVIPTHTNFLSQLAASAAAASASLHINSATTNHCNASTKTATTTSCGTSEPSSTSRLNSSPLISNVQANKGTAPMDLDNDLDIERTHPTSTKNCTVTSATISDINDFKTEGIMTSRLETTTTPATTSTIPISTNTNMIMNIPDAHIYLNGLMANNMAMNSGLVYFPTTGTTTNNVATPSASGNAMQQLDTTAIMAAAMQQVQRNYAYSVPEINTMNKVALTSDNCSGSNLTKSSTKMKEVIKTKSCVLLPPNPNAPPPTIRERPPGCRTVFVGGLPENVTEEILREIFDSCGEITTLRMSKKNFCHIRFRCEESIDQAIFLSGYRIRLGTTNEPANYGRLHVDYAQARDDQYDYECRQRQLQREQRHRDRHRSHDRSNSVSPPPLSHYSDHEAAIIADHLRNDDTFVKAMQTITVWLERGDCNKRNANIFYSMIQSTYSHVRRLTGDKQLFEEELRKARELYRKQMLTMSTQFTQIEKMFNAASHKKVWDHFTKAQRKNIDQWKKLATELRSTQIDDDEMEMSDDDYYGSNHGHNHSYSHIHGHGVRSAKRKRYECDHLKEENDSLRCQLEAIRNEMSSERTDLHYSSEFREKQIKVLQETIRNMQTQLLQTKMREQKDTKTIEQLEKRLKEAAVKQLLLNTKIRETIEKVKEREQLSITTTPTLTPIACDNNQNNDIIDIDVDKGDDDVKIIDEIHQHSDCYNTLNIKGSNQKQIHEIIQNSEIVDAMATKARSLSPLISSNEKFPHKENTEITITQKLSMDDAKLLALSAAYLILQPRGCTTAAICSYIKNVTANSCLQCKELNALLENYQNLFRAVYVDNTNNHQNNNSSTKDDSTIWIFCGFASTQTTSAT